jgi:hypothetical protein
LENDTVPKLIVLFDGHDEAAAMLAKSAAVGAGEVRFAEVDVRAVGASGEHKELAGASQLGSYDGVLLALSGSELPAGVAALLGELASGGQLPNMVFGLTGTAANALQQVARVGGIIVSEPIGADATDRARKLGARMAKVTGWVHHALGHEAEHHHHH